MHFKNTMRILQITTLLSDLTHNVSQKSASHATWFFIRQQLKFYFQSATEYRSNTTKSQHSLIKCTVKLGYNDHGYNKLTAETKERSWKS